MSVLLAIETATDACSVALSVGDTIIRRDVCAPREHAARVLGMVDSVLAEAEILSEGVSTLVFGRGPGSFLGTRIAASIAQSLALAWGCELVSVSTLASLAEEAYQKHGVSRVLSAWDARMQGIYWGDYACVDSVMVAKKGDLLSSPDVFSGLDIEGEALLAGNAWATYADALGSDFLARFPLVDTDCYPSAAGLIPLAKQAEVAADYVDLASAVPVYLRYPVTSV